MWSHIGSDLRAAGAAHMICHPPPNVLRNLCRHLTLHQILHQVGCTKYLEGGEKVGREALAHLLCHLHHSVMTSHLAHQRQYTAFSPTCCEPSTPSDPPTVDNPTQILLFGLPGIKPLLRTLKFILDWYSIQRVGSKFKAVAALVQLSPLKDVEANNRLR